MAGYCVLKVVEGYWVKVMDVFDDFLRMQENVAGEEYAEAWSVLIKGLLEAP